MLIDTELNDLIAKTGPRGNGAIRYLGCQTDLGWMRRLHGALRAQFMFKYTLRPERTLEGKELPCLYHPTFRTITSAKELCRFKEDGGSTFTDLGNCAVVCLLADGRKEGTFLVARRRQDKGFYRNYARSARPSSSRSTRSPATNLAFFALGDVDTTVPGAITINGLSKTEFAGEIKVVGTNDIGQKVDFTATVSFVPSGDFSFITDEDDFIDDRDRGRSAEGRRRFLRRLDGP